MEHTFIRNLDIKYFDYNKYNYVRNLTRTKFYLTLR